MVLRPIKTTGPPRERLARDLACGFGQSAALAPGGEDTRPDGTAHTRSSPRIVPVAEANRSVSMPRRWSIETKRFGSG